MYIEPPRKLLMRFAVPHVAEIGCTLATTARAATATHAILGMRPMVVFPLPCSVPRRHRSVANFAPRKFFVRFGLVLGFASGCRDARAASSIGRAADS